MKKKLEGSPDLLITFLVTFMIICLVCMIGSIFSGCTPYFGNMQQYNNGKWHNYASADDVSKIKSDQLAFRKLEESPVDVDAVSGYKGIVANLTRHDNINFVIIGPEKKSYFLAPGERVEDYLVPGEYTYYWYIDGKLAGTWKCHVTSQKHFFLGGYYHWFNCYEDKRR